MVKIATAVAVISESDWQAPAATATVDGCLTDAGHRVQLGLSQSKDLEATVASGLPER